MKIKSNSVLFIIMVFSFGLAMLTQTNAETSKSGKNRSDVNITAEIRQDIMKQDEFSTSAQNIQIFTRKGKVTLKGSVPSESERNSLIRHANLSVGAQNVTNEISVDSDLNN